MIQLKYDVSLSKSSFSYRSLDQVLEVINLLKEARDKVDAKYGEQVCCDVDLHTGDDAGFQVVFDVRQGTGATEKDLENAVHDFFVKAGFPKLVLSGSDYDLVDKVLNAYGKKTQRKFTGLLVGKQVVDV